MKSPVYTKNRLFFFLLLASFVLFSFGLRATAAEAVAAIPAAEKNPKLAAAAPATKPLPAEAIGQIIWVKGEVQAVDLNQHARVLQRRSPIFEHDTIVTGSGSGQIVFTDNSMVALREGTTLRIDQYKYNPSKPVENKYVGGLVKGGFRTITGLISKTNPDGYQVKTPVATIGVRGTEYSAVCGQSPTNAAGCDFRLDKGVISISNKAGVIELDKSKNIIYAQTTGVNVKPVVTDKPSPALKNMPAIVRTSSIQPGSGTGNANCPFCAVQPGSSTPPKGPQKVEGFCIQ